MSDPSAKNASQLVSKTCQNCFSLKIRCDRTLRQEICDRCARLGKQCAFRPARRRDNSAKRDSRIQALEQQVQDLLRLQRPDNHVQRPIPEEPDVNPTTPERDADVVDEDIVSIERAETLVDMYKTDMMPHFPFVIVPSHVTGGELRHSKPFLFLAIVSVACFHDLGTQDRLCHRFKYMVSEKVLLGGDDCLELEYLQGLLVVLAWNQYHGRSKFFSQYQQLAISLAVDMRLDRKIVHPKPTNAGSKRDPISDGVGKQPWGAEEHRAAAGLFYISSTVSKLLEKMNTFQCTPSIEEGCLSLRQQAEYRTDRDLYHVIQLQKIIEGIDKVATSTSSDHDAQSAYLRVRSELESFRIYLRSDVSDSHLLFMQFHTAKLLLYQVAFFERNLQQSPNLHLNILMEGLEGAKSFLDLYLWLPPKSEMALTNSEWVQLSFGVTLAAKFAVVSKDPGVELETRDLRNRLNIDNVFRHLTLRIGALVGRGGDGNKQKDIFFHYEQRTRKIQKWYERMMRATAVIPEPRTATVEHQQVTPPHSHSPASQRSTAQSYVPVSTNFSHQQPQSYAQSQSYTQPQSYLQPQPNTYQSEPSPVAHYHQSLYQLPIATMGMTPMSTYASSSPVPYIAYPDLMHAQGWDNMFSIPMETDAMIFDVTQGYGLGMASPPSDESSTWESPPAQ